MQKKQYEAVEGYKSGKNQQLFQGMEQVAN